MKQSPYTNKVLKKITWVTGSARSGTTLVGKILSTLKGVEYGFEPDLLFSLLPLIKKIEKKYWNEIYEDYIIEDIFFNLCNGRKINLKKNDYSSIYNSLNKKQVNQKLNLSLRRKEFDKYLKKNKKTLIIKTPSLANSFTKLQDYYPENRFVVTSRSTSAITSSLLKKGWFKKSGYLYSTQGRTKQWLEPRLYKTWINSNEIEKTKIYLSIMEKYLKQIKKKHVVDFKRLLSNPNKVIKEMCDYLNLKKTKKTDEMIETIDIKKNI
jgi:hypothetical protein